MTPSPSITSKMGRSTGASWSGSDDGREGCTIHMSDAEVPRAPELESLPERSTSPDAAPFRIVDRVRWSDVDAAGIVCYGAYLRFFELAETELFRASGLTVAYIQEHFGLWLVRR